MKKGQAAIEFLFFVGIAIVILIVYTSISFNYLNLTLKRGEAMDAQTLADTIKNEINLAARVEDGYIREITLLTTIDGKDYTTDIEDRTVVLSFEGSDYIGMLTTDIELSDDIINNGLVSGNIYLLKKENNIVSLELKE